jgi:hypothetical protein
MVGRNRAAEHHPALLLLRRGRYLDGEALLLSAALDGQRNLGQPRLSVPVRRRLRRLVIACKILCRSLSLRAARNQSGSSGCG